MTDKNLPTERYHRVSIALHWVLGLALIGLLGVGVYMVDLPFSPQRLKLYNWHKWAGMTILLLSALRLLWRLTHRPPALPAHIAARMPSWQRRALDATHLGLYALFFLVPLLGWAYTSAAGFPVVMFGLVPLPDLLAADPQTAEMLKPLHGYSANALMALIALHIAAAVKHQLIDKDGLIQRMLPLRAGRSA